MLFKYCIFFFLREKKRLLKAMCYRVLNAYIISILALDLLSSIDRVAKGWRPIKKTSVYKAGGVFVLLPSELIVML